MTTPSFEVWSWQQITQLNERMAEMEASQRATQADIDALTAAVGQVSTDLVSVRDKLQAEIDSLANAGVDISGLQAAVAPLDENIKSLGDIKPSA